MRKAALVFSVLIAASFATTADAAKKAAKPDPAVAATQNTAAFMRDATNPYMATSKAAAPTKKAKAGKKGKKA
jgi:hypothetical protein